MYADQQLKAAPVLGGANTAPMQIGVMSAMRELIDAVNETANLSDNLSSSLGISQPPEGKAAAGPEALLGVVVELTRRLRSSNLSLSESLRHLNS
jgi:hypothetical protein